MTRKPNGAKPRTRCFVYCLRDPETQHVWYVGTTCRPQFRKTQHLVEYRKIGRDGVPPRLNDANRKVTRQHWFAAMFAAGRTPEFVILQRVTVGRMSLREQEWTSKFIEEGHPIVNVHSAGVYRRFYEITGLEEYRRSK